MNLYLAKLFWKPGQDEGSSTKRPSSVDLSFFTCGDREVQIWHHSFQSACEYLYSSFKKGCNQSEEALLLSFHEDTWKRGKVTKNIKSLRRMGQVEQEKVYSAPFINIYQGFLSTAQAPTQELQLKENSCGITRSHQFHLPPRRNQVPSVPFQLKTRHYQTSPHTLQGTLSFLSSKTGSANGLKDNNHG